MKADVAGRRDSSGPQSSGEPALATAPERPTGLLDTLSSITREASVDTITRPLPTVAGAIRTAGAPDRIGGGVGMQGVSHARSSSAGATNRPLIEPISKTLPAPVHTVALDRVARQMTVTVELPLCATIACVDVDMTSSTLHLLVPDVYELYVVFPESVDEAAAVAKFVKSKRLLKLTIPLMP